MTAPKSSASRLGAGLCRRELHFQGRVQGVGFRFTTQRIAGRFAVTGFVRNLPDGRVLVVVEGESDEVEQFAEAIQIELGRYIQHADSCTLGATGEYGSFEIRP